MFPIRRAEPGDAGEAGPSREPNVRLYERHGYHRVPNDSILIRLDKDREPPS